MLLISVHLTQFNKIQSIEQGCCTGQLAELVAPVAKLFHVA